MDYDNPYSRAREREDAERIAKNARIWLIVAIVTGLITLGVHIGWTYWMQYQWETRHAHQALLWAVQ